MGIAQAGLFLGLDAARAASRFRLRRRAFAACMPGGLHMPLVGPSAPSSLPGRSRGRPRPGRSRLMRHPRLAWLPSSPASATARTTTLDQRGRNAQLPPGPWPGQRAADGWGVIFSDWR